MTGGGFDNPRFIRSLENYTSIVTDLVGVRVLHLFKHEWEPINQYILDNWIPLENIKAYVRKGDENADLYSEKDFKVEDHKAGYRSIHYIIPTSPTKNQIVAEIQVRTLFEEGWSEIDHIVRYPNYTDDELLKNYLMILNRMAGSADEMGSFVNYLKEYISKQENKHIEMDSEIKTLTSKLEQQKSTFPSGKQWLLDDVVESINKLPNMFSTLNVDLNSLKFPNVNDITIGTQNQLGSLVAPENTKLTSLGVPLGSTDSSPFTSSGEKISVLKSSTDDSSGKE